MNKLFIFVGSAVGGYAFWALGELIGLEFVGCFFLSGAGSLLGVYAGWKVARKLVE